MPDQTSNRPTMPPRPWLSDGRTLRDGRGYSIASGGNNRAVTGPELAAALRLAAASPELYAAARALLDWLRDYTGHAAFAELDGSDPARFAPPVVAMLRAIAKVEGRA